MSVTDSFSNGNTVHPSLSHSKTNIVRRNNSVNNQFLLYHLLVFNNIPQLNIESFYAYTHFMNTNFIY